MFTSILFTIPKQLEATSVSVDGRTYKRVENFIRIYLSQSAICFRHFRVRRKSKKDDNKVGEKQGKDQITG